jgi:hypothetical protein
MRLLIKLLRALILGTKLDIQEVTTLNLGAKLNIQVVTTLAVMLGALLLVMRSGIQRITVQTSQQRVAQEAEIVQGRFAVTEQ